MKVFVVEDEVSLQILYKEIFTLKGIDILDIAYNGEEAVSKFRSFSEKPDIILMDHRMPKKSGIDASKEILKLDNKARILFVSADESVREEALSIGAIGFINKPLDMFKLVEHAYRIMKLTET